MSEMRNNIEMSYRQIVENLEYFKDLDTIVPIGTLLGDSNMNCTKRVLKNTLIDVLEQYSEVFEALRLT